MGLTLYNEVNRIRLEENDKPYLPTVKAPEPISYGRLMAHMTDGLDQETPYKLCTRLPPVAGVPLIQRAHTGPA